MINFLLSQPFNLIGHSDVVMGMVSLNRDDLYERLKFLQNGEYKKPKLKLLYLLVTSHIEWLPPQISF